MVTPAIDVSKSELRHFCRRHSIQKLSLFGSILRDDFSEESDVDVLVDFAPGTRVGLRIFEMEDELARLFGGRKVDMVRTAALNPRLRDLILNSAQVQYDEG